MPKPILVAGLAVAFWTAAIAQQNPVPASPQTFKTTLDLVHFDVSVLDKKRQPIGGLTATDFTVLEDGKPQPIVAFAAIDVPRRASSPAAKWMAEVSPDTRSNGPQDNPEGRLFVLVLDDALLPGDPGAVQNAKKIARGIVERLSPIDQVAVVFTLASRNSEDFTTDRRKLLAAIDTLTPGPASHLLGWDAAVPRDPRQFPPVFVPAIDSDAVLRMGAMRTLRMVGDTLAAAPQRRKAMILVSPGIAADILGDARPTKNGVDPGLPIREANHTLVSSMKELYQQLSRTNVTVYSFDPCGFFGLESYIMTAATSLPAIKPANGPVSPFYNWLQPDGPPRPQDLAQHSATLEMDFLQSIASNSGGRAVVNTNDFTAGLDGVFEENGSYYLIGYERPAKNAPGSIHRIEVKVNRPDVTVRSQRDYEVETPPSPKSKQPPDKDAATNLVLERAMAGPVAGSALPITVALAPIAQPINAAAPSKNVGLVTVIIGFDQPAVSARTPQVIELLGRLYTPDGLSAGAGLRQKAAFTLVPGEPAAPHRYEVLTQIGPVAPGRYVLRLAAYRATDAAVGSIYAPVEVPDFRAAALSVSGVWLESDSGPSAIPRDAFTSLFPIVPTAQREFATRDHVGAYYVVYQGGQSALAPAVVTVHLIDDQGTTIANVDRTIEADRFDKDARAATDRFNLPLSSLRAGQYLLRFDVKSGQSTTRRDVVFRVR